MMGTSGPAWTRGEIEPPRGEKDMGGWVVRPADRSRAAPSAEFCLRGSLYDVRTAACISGRRVHP